MFRILTLAEIGDFLAAECAARGRIVGLIPEIKHSTYFAGIGLPMEDRFVRGLGEKQVSGDCAGDYPVVRNRQSENVARRAR